MNNLMHDITEPKEYIRGKKDAKRGRPAEAGAGDDYMHGFDLYISGPSMLADTGLDNRVSLFA